MLWLRVEVEVVCVWWCVVWVEEVSHYWRDAPDSPPSYTPASTCLLETDAPDSTTTVNVGEDVVELKKATASLLSTQQKVNTMLNRLGLLRHCGCFCCCLLLLLLLLVVVV